MVDVPDDTRGRALLMDDDPARSSRRCAQLTSSGWHVIQAFDETDLLSAAHGDDVDVVLLHVHAEDACDMDLPAVIRLAAGVPHLPVVILAPKPPEAARCRYLDRGADEIVCDSISPAELTARMRALMRVKILQDELSASREALAASLDRERTLLDQARRDNVRLTTLAGTDPLTHLQNVRHFDSFLESQFRIARRYDRKLSVLMFDIDHFKVVNDTHGHPSGDYVLKEFAVILKTCVRDSDVVARTGGEEFSIILPNAGRIQSRRFARRIRRAVSGRTFNVYGHDIHVTTSIGLASYPEDAEIVEPQMLVFLADQALLHAKQTGRDRLACFSEMDRETRRKLVHEYRASRPARASAETEPV